MRDDIREAIDSAASGEDRRGLGLHAVTPSRRMSFERAKWLLLNIVRDLPEDMTVQELREDLEN